MKKSLKKQITDLLSNSKGKKEFLIAFARKEKPGIFEVEDKELNEAEFAELQKDYEQTITFVEHGRKI